MRAGSPPKAAHPTRLSGKGKRGTLGLPHGRRVQGGAPKAPEVVVGGTGHAEGKPLHPGPESCTLTDMATVPMGNPFNTNPTGESAIKLPHTAQFDEFDRRTAARTISQEGQEALIYFQGLIRKTGYAIISTTKPTREQSLALTALEEALLWATRAVE